MIQAARALNTPRAVTGLLSFSVKSARRTIDTKFLNQNRASYHIA